MKARTALLCGALSLASPVSSQVSAQIWGHQGVTVYQVPLAFTVGAYSGVNNHGQLAGTFNNFVAVFTAGGNPLNLATDFERSAGAGINNAGQVTGSWFGQNEEYHATVWTGGAANDLGNLPGGGHNSHGTAINATGQITGFADLPRRGQHAIRWRSGALEDLGTLGGQSSYGLSINDAGTVVGFSAMSNGDTHAFSYSGTTMSDLGSLGGSYAVARGINASGQIVGSSYITGDYSEHAFLWNGGVFHDLGVDADDYSYATDIASNGLVIGYDSYFGASLWETSTFGYTPFSLDAIVNDGVVNSGWSFSEALQVSDDGRWVLAYADNSAQNFSGYVLLEETGGPDGGAVTAPEPATFVLLGTGMLGLFGISRRRTERKNSLS